MQKIWDFHKLSVGKFIRWWPLIIFRFQISLVNRKRHRWWMKRSWSWPNIAPFLSHAHLFRSIQRKCTWNEFQINRNCKNDMAYRWSVMVVLNCLRFRIKRSFFIGFKSNTRNSKKNPKKCNLKFQFTVYESNLTFSVSTQKLYKYLFLHLLVCCQRLSNF